MSFRRRAAVVLIGLLATVTTLVSARPALAAPGYFKIHNFGSGMCIEPDRYADPFANGDPVVQRTCDSSALQQWHPFKYDIFDNVYLYVNRASGKCLDVRDGRNADRTPMQQWECRGGASMRSDLEPDSFTGVHQIISQIGGRCLDVDGGSLADGAQIQIYRCTGFGNAAQVWYFEEVP